MFVRVVKHCSTLINWSLPTSYFVCTEIKIRIEPEPGKNSRRSKEVDVVKRRPLKEVLLRNKSGCEPLNSALNYEGMRC